MAPLSVTTECSHGISGSSCSKSRRISGSSFSLAGSAGEPEGALGVGELCSTPSTSALLIGADNTHHSLQICTLLRCRGARERRSPALLRVRLDLEQYQLGIGAPEWWKSLCFTHCV